MKQWIWLVAMLALLLTCISCSEDKSEEVPAESESEDDDEDDEDDEEDEDDEDDEDDEEEEAPATRLSEFDKRAEALWKRLATYEKAYLTRWGPVFKMEGRYASDLIDAWNDLGYALTGPDGLWRTTVPNVWFECGKKPDQKICKALQEHEEVFAEWDIFQEKISRMEPRRGGSFLLEHIDDIEQHMDTYVMEKPTREAMEQTKFYREFLMK